MLITVRLKDPGCGGPRALCQAVLADVDPARERGKYLGMTGGASAWLQLQDRCWETGSLPDLVGPELSRSTVRRGHPRGPVQCSSRERRNAARVGVGSSRNAPMAVEAPSHNVRPYPPQPCPRGPRESGRVSSRRSTSGMVIHSTNQFAVPLPLALTLAPGTALTHTSSARRPRGTGSNRITLGAEGAPRLRCAVARGGRATAKLLQTGPRDTLPAGPPGIDSDLWIGPPGQS